MSKPSSYLALGDSYTIGESIPLQKSFPYQTVQFLRKAGFYFTAPEIIAQTGWTTDELTHALEDYNLLTQYDFLTLLIGVNNQYRGRDIIEYKDQLESLIKKATGLVNNKSDRVIVLSIPDYGATPFVPSENKEKISKEIAAFNSVNKALTIQYKTSYLDITEGSGEASTDLTLVAADLLHPSEKEYVKWARKLADLIAHLLK
jgi:lysophospholipase L1-like esterase